jgi:hypothetical protein
VIHFLYLVAFALFVAAVFAVFVDGTPKERVVYGVKTFVQFVGIALVIAWFLYFVPW